MTAQYTPVHLLLVEDDAISRNFLAEALRQLPARVDAAEDIGQSVQFAQQSAHSLCLVDIHLPDGDGATCLRALRKVSQAPALAITAGASRDELEALSAAGFLEVLMKPVSVALLHATVRRLLHRAPAMIVQDGCTLPVWDEDHALAAIGGNPNSLLALRRMFLAELPSTLAQLTQAQTCRDSRAIHSLLHKLKGSCRFVGATRLAACVDRLSFAVLDPTALKSFELAAQDALQGAPLSPPGAA